MPKSLTINLQRPHSGQKDILDGRNRFNVLACGRRFGKTSLGTYLIVETALQSGKPFGWFAPTYRLLEEAYRAINRILKPVIKRSVTTPYPSIELINGGVIDFWTLDDPSTVARGRKYARILVDEAAMCRHLEEAWTQAIRPTLTDYAGDAYFCSTPKGINYFHKLYKMEEHDEEWKSFRLPSTANPFIDPEEIQKASKGIPSIAFRQEYEAEFLDVAGTRIRREWIQKGQTIPNSCERFMGVDLAISTKEGADYTAIVVMEKDKDNLLYVTDCTRVQASFNDVLKTIQKMADKHTPSCIAIENVQYQVAVVQELLRRDPKLNVIGVRPKGDKVSRFALLEARYEQGLIFHRPSLPPYFEDELLAFPMGKNDDLVDAMVYAYEALKQGQRVFEAI
jgi:predicted phage terminase large subunit-like protein